MEAIFRILDAMEYDIIIQDRNSSTSWKLKRVEDEE
jgi:hypothetical protein